MVARTQRHAQVQVQRLHNARGTCAQYYARGTCAHSYALSYLLHTLWHAEHEAQAAKGATLRKSRHLQRTKSSRRNTIHQTQHHALRTQHRRRATMRRTKLQTRHRRHQTHIYHHTQILDTHQTSKHSCRQSHALHSQETTHRRMHVPKNSKISWRKPATHTRSATAGASRRS